MNPSWRSRFFFLLAVIGIPECRYLLATLPDAGICISAVLIIGSLAVAAAYHRKGILAAACVLPLVAFWPLGFFPGITPETAALIGYGGMLLLSIPYLRYFYPLQPMNIPVSGIREFMVLFAGVCWGVAGYMFFGAGGFTSGPADHWVVLIPLIAFAEEIIFRHLLLSAAPDTWNPGVAAVFGSLLYAFYTSDMSISGVAYAYLTGMGLSYLFLLHRRIYIPLFLNMIIKYIVLLSMVRESAPFISPIN